MQRDRKCIEIRESAIREKRMLSSAQRLVVCLHGVPKSCGVCTTMMQLCPRLLNFITRLF
jgi:hypothetical protein